jgi:hypothetical protein
MEVEDDARIGYVVLRHLACLSRPGFSLEPACTPEEDLIEYGVIRDGFRIDLEAAPPLDTRPAWFTAYARILRNDAGKNEGENSGEDHGPDLRTRLLNHAIDLPREDWEAFQSLWQEDQDAPLLLARVRLVMDEGRVIASPAPDNSVRAVLPQVQTLGEILVGAQLAAGPVPTRLRAARPVLSGSVGGPPKVSLSFSHPILPATLSGAISLRRLDASGWVPLAVAQLTLGGDQVSAEIEAEGAYTDGMVISVSLAGAGPEPLLDLENNPLAGLLGSPDPGPGMGNDVHLILIGGA